jgi:hypothetical protein
MTAIKPPSWCNGWHGEVQEVTVTEVSSKLHEVKRYEVFADGVSVGHVARKQTTTETKIKGTRLVKRGKYNGRTIWVAFPPGDDGQPHYRPERDARNEAIHMDLVKWKGSDG